MLKELFKNLRAVESFSKTAKGQWGNYVACSSFLEINTDGKNFPWLRENPEVWQTSILNVFWFIPVYLFYLYSLEGNIQHTNWLRSFLLVQLENAALATHILHSECVLSKLPGTVTWSIKYKHNIGNLIPFNYFSSATF